MSETTTNSSITAAGVTFLAAFAIWLAAAVWMAFMSAPGNVWVAWGISFVLIVAVSGLVSAVTARKPRGKAKNITGQPTRTTQILNSANDTLAEAERIRDDIGNGMRP